MNITEPPHNLVLSKTDHKNNYADERFNPIKFRFHLKTIVNYNRLRNDEENISLDNFTPTPKRNKNN